MDILKEMAIQNAHVLRIASWILLGIPLIIWLGQFSQRYCSKHYSPQHGLIVNKLIVYGGMALIGISVLGELGFELVHILGAAGIAGVAIGFAAQTTLSNLISGLFLVVEKPFVVGDVITVDGVTGVVLSIDALSVKLRQFDNKFVRIPNETILKTQVTTATRFPIRRVDINVGVAYKEDLRRVRDVLLEVAHHFPQSLEEPAPQVIFTGYGSSSIDMLLTVWTAKENWLNTKNEMIIAIKERFDQEGIEIPFPHLSLYAGSATEPMPVKIQEGASKK
ncbi:mechanosensitive ion channel family protein [Candidatus Sumerlaeota bacterium]|nr:mechanosensitive ion channel family protein [Candidatus Sumerlaeota bacterium]